MDAFQMGAIAHVMAEVVSREPGRVGKFDAARKVYRAKEVELLNRCARGSARGFSELDALRKSPLYFPPTMYEGHVDYGPNAKARSHAMQVNGDFRMGLRSRGEPHPAMLGMVPRVLVVSRAGGAMMTGCSERGTAAHERSRQSQHLALTAASDVVGASTQAAAMTTAPEFSARSGSARSTATSKMAMDRILLRAASSRGSMGSHSSSQKLGVVDGRSVLATARPLPSGWVKLRSVSRPEKTYYADTQSKHAQWDRPAAVP